MTSRSSHTHTLMFDIYAIIPGNVHRNTDIVREVCTETKHINTTKTELPRVACADYTQSSNVHPTKAAHDGVRSPQNELVQRHTRVFAVVALNRR